MRRTLESQEQRWEPHGVHVDQTPEPLLPERHPVDAEPEVEEPVPAEEEGLEVQAPPLAMEPNDLVLDPIPDHQDVRIDTEGEGLGEPDPLVLARSPEDLSPAIRQYIPGPRVRAQVQDRDPVLSRVKDWIRQGIIPGRLELDFGEPSLKAYVKIMPVLKLKPVIPEPDEDDLNLDILVKTDIQGTVQSERYCLPEDLIVTLITDLHLQLTHYRVETIAMTLRHLVWFPDLWARTRQVLLQCPGCVQKHNHQARQANRRVLLS